MGGGVGVGCYGSYCVVGDSCQIVMLEVGIGLVFDVGGSYIFVKVLDYMGEYFGFMVVCMDVGDVIIVGFVDYYIFED